VAVERGVALVAVVGLGMRGRPGIAARTFGALAGASVNVLAVAQGSSELNITMAVSEREAAAALRALHDEYQLDKVRPLSDDKGRTATLALLGFGQIGRALAGQLAAQERHLRQHLGVDLRVVAVADRSGLRVEEDGFGARELDRLAKRKAAGGKLHEEEPPPRSSAPGAPAASRGVATVAHPTAAAVLTLADPVPAPAGAAAGAAGVAASPLGRLREQLRAHLWPLPARRPILVDLTSEETGPLLREALEQGFHVVLANKKPLAGPQADYDLLMETARRRGLALRYEATAGAGLPVLDTLAKLEEAGDRVESILGCFSGTLGYLMSALEDGRSFSAAVHEAWKLGYTEPDPRDDLSGRDVARKALILARALGRRVEPEQVALEPLFPPELDHPDPARFVAGLAALDEPLAARVERARRDGKTLRYVARIGRRAVRVGLEAVPIASPMGSLRGTANQVVIQSRRYHDNPLVVTGPGAGAEVTAAGVLNDVAAIAVEERRR
jgi:bifunctional aspartokinase / homoserine dehydrogenase 1